MKILKIKEWLSLKKMEKARQAVANIYRGFASDEWIDKNILNK